MSLLIRLPVIVLALVFGVTGSQVPEFVQQYKQRLGGAVDELSAFVRQFDADAQASGLTREAALEEYAGSDSVFLGRRGESVVDLIQRYERLATHKLVIENAGPVTRAVSFFEGMDKEIATRTLDDYEPAVPVTMEGGIFAGAGILAALIGFLGLRGGARATGRMARRMAGRSPDGGAKALRG